jgi:adenine phosphoribosyltransferase
MQADSIKPGQTVIVVDDLIATGASSSSNISCPSYHSLAGGSAKAAGELIAKLGGTTLEYLFIVELMFLKGRDHLDAPVYSLVKSDD